MLVMIFTLTLEVLAKTNFYLFNFYDWYKTDLANGIMWSEDHKFEETVFMFLPVTFLSMGITINVRNWLYYYMKVNEMVQF